MTNAAAPATRPSFNLAGACLAPNARRLPETIGLVVAGTDPADDLSLTFAEIEQRVLRLAGGIAALDLPPGSRIVLRMGNEVDTVLLFFAILAAGHVAIPTSIQLTHEEAAGIAKDAGAAVVFTGGPAAAETFPGHTTLGPPDRDRLRTADSLSAYAETRPEDPAYLVYTSGTTRRPKGVLHAHRVFDGREPMRGGAWLGLQPGDRVLHAGAFNWTYTLGVGVLDPWSRGATAVLARSVADPGDWPRIIDRHAVTVFAAVPGVYRQILKSAAGQALTMPTLRHGVAAGEALPVALRDAWRSATGTEIHEAFGMSEISTFISTGPDVPFRAGSPGRPQPGRRIAVLPRAGGSDPLPAGEVGLLAVHRSDPGLMLGYWNRPDEDAATTRGEWFVGGDLVSMEADGTVRHHGRADDVMNALGYRVSPLEVEVVIAGDPEVADVGVTEWRVRPDLSIIAAFVVLKDGVIPDEARLAARCAAHLAAYKRPKAFHFVDALPRTANGKLQRRLLPDLVTEA